jgi:acid phosphatase
LIQKFLFLALSVAFICCSKSNDDTATPIDKPPTDTVVNTFPHPDHIVFVWFENKDYDSIVGNANAPYINSLIAEGTLFTNMYAITHPSYQNYVDFFAGDPNGVINDKCLDPQKLTTPNLYTQLNSVGKSFAWYSEGLPDTGSTVCQYQAYVAKHNPTTLFANVPGSANKPFSTLPADFTQLENVVCISPNLNNDMHDGSIARGDKWLKTNLSSLADWCKTHNSIFVVYFDENDGAQGNKIPVIAVGQNVKTNYQDTTTYNHYNWTRTACKMFSAPEQWTSNISTISSINSCWK